MVGLAVAGAAFGAVVYFQGYANGSYLLPSLFIALFVAWVIVGTYANHRRRPARVGFSERGVEIAYRGNRRRVLSWDTIGSVSIRRFLGDHAANIRYVDGRVEDKAHIYEEAALEVKRRFEEWQAARRG
ncbi:MAG: hypothetical protein ACE5KY_05035 [Candidatus Tectimicrobiota bacterium]